MRISLIAGARPNFMKVAPLVRAFRDVDLETRLIHTGQHYDQRMSNTFFQELAIPEPDVNLGVGSGGHIFQTTEIMRRLEHDFSDWRPDVVVIVGDVNSTLAAALTAAKMHIRVAHVEAGLRSFDRSMPEEVNRVLVDSVSHWLFASEPAAVENLKNEGIDDPCRVHLVGNVMIDTLLANLETARARRSYEAYGMEQGQYALLTLHRPSNVDSRERLEAIMRAIHELNEQLPVVFPIHPRTAKQLADFGLDNQANCNGFLRLDPVGYHDMLSLLDGARLVITDSGGVQEETTALRVPCMTIRDNTERPITIKQGSNRLVPCQFEQIKNTAQSLLSMPSRLGSVPEMWDGRAAHRIADTLA